MDRPWKVIAAFVGVFIAGAVFGGFFTLRSAGRWFAPERPKGAVKAAPGSGQAAGNATILSRSAQQVMRSLNPRLNLTAEQQKAIRPIVSRATEDLQRMQREHLADVTRTTERMYADLAPVLTVEQRTRLQQMREEMFERAVREREKRGEASPVAAKKVAEKDPKSGP
ncbi:MAG: hypothetical protein HZC55_12825 [Verrucomicrobia bacterium]|jgi:hypothetical protein|nr:hypothetical protein [Verrucomicrobiota bacterium]